MDALTSIEQVLKKHVPECDIAFMALGTTKSDVSTMGAFEFHKLNLDVPKRFLKAMFNMQVLRIALLSHPTASAKGRGNRYVSVKADLLQYLRRLQSQAGSHAPGVSVFNVPFMLTDEKDHAGMNGSVSKKDMIRERAALKLGFSPAKAVHVRDVAKAMVADALENIAIAELQQRDDDRTTGMYDGSVTGSQFDESERNLQQHAPSSPHFSQQSVPLSNTPPFHSGVHVAPDIGSQHPPILEDLHSSGSSGSGSEIHGSRGSSYRGGASGDAPLEGLPLGGSRMGASILEAAHMEDLDAERLRFEGSEMYDSLLPAPYPRPSYSGSPLPPSYRDGIHLKGMDCGGSQLDGSKFEGSQYETSQSESHGFQAGPSSHYNSASGFKSRPNTRWVELNGRQIVNLANETRYMQRQQNIEKRQRRAIPPDERISGYARQQGVFHDAKLSQPPESGTYSPVARPRTESTRRSAVESLSMFDEHVQPQLHDAALSGSRDSVVSGGSPLHDEFLENGGDGRTHHQAPIQPSGSSGDQPSLSPTPSSEPAYVLDSNYAGSTTQYFGSQQPDLDAGAGSVESLAEQLRRHLTYMSDNHVLPDVPYSGFPRSSRRRELTHSHSSPTDNLNSSAPQVSDHPSSRRQSSPIDGGGGTAVERQVFSKSSSFRSTGSPQISQTKRSLRRENTTPSHPSRHHGAYGISASPYPIYPVGSSGQHKQSFYDQENNLDMMRMEQGGYADHSASRGRRKHERTKPSSVTTQLAILAGKVIAATDRPSARRRQQATIPQNENYDSQPVRGNGDMRAAGKTTI